MKIIVIDQLSNSIHEVAPEPSPRRAEFGLHWFDPTIEAGSFQLGEDSAEMASKRIRFRDGCEIEVDCETGELLSV